MASRARKAAGAGEGTHAARRRARPPAARAALGSDREGVHPRDGGRPEDARGAVRGPLSARDLQLYVRPRLRRGLPGLLVDRRQLQRRARPASGARRDDDLHLEGPDREAARLSRAHGLGLRVGIELRERLQRGLRTLATARRGERAEPAVGRLAQFAASAGTDAAGYVAQRPGLPSSRSRMARST